MRAIAIVGRAGVDGKRLARCIEARKIRHRRIEREKRIERQGRVLAVESERQLAVQRDIVGIADRRQS
jgi:hypothetical protein